MAYIDFLTTHWPELVKWPPLSYSESQPYHLCVQKVESWGSLANSSKEHHRQFYICFCNCFINAYVVKLVGKNIRAGTVIVLAQLPLPRASHVDWRNEGLK